MDELDDVADDSHDQETNAHCLRDPDEFLLVGLGATVHEQSTLLKELSGHISEFFDVLHGDECWEGGSGNVVEDVVDVRGSIDWMDGFSVRSRL